MRQQLARDDVEFLVVHSTNTNINQDLSFEDIIKHRHQEGYPDVGFHFVIHRCGMLSAGIPMTQTGTHTSHFDTRSLGILMVGGKTTRGKPSDNYTKEQKAALTLLLNVLSLMHRNATPKGAGELLGGTSPHFKVADLNDTDTSSA